MKRPSASTIAAQRPARLPPDEIAVSGHSLALPLVERISVIRSHLASRISWHAHQRLEFLFLLEGATAYEFADGRAVELAGGQFLLIPAGARHRGLHEVRRPALLCGVLFDPRPPSAVRQTPFTRGDLEWLGRQCAGGAFTPRRMSVELRRLARSLVQQVCGPAPADESAAALRLTLCATLFESARQLTASRSLEPTRAAQAAIDYMQAHLAEPLRMEAVAAAAQCSRSRLFQIFKESTGMAPNDYLQRVRVNHAQALLSAGDEPITSIALRCGFSTSQYFSNVFRKYSGSSPSDFRKRQP